MFSEVLVRRAPAGSRKSLYLPWGTVPSSVGYACVIAHADGETLRETRATPGSALTHDPAHNPALY